MYTAGRGKTGIIPCRVPPGDLASDYNAKVRRVSVIIAGVFLSIPTVIFIILHRIANP